MEKTFAVPDGLQLAYEVRGEGAAAPLVLLHGWSGFRHDFETHWDALAKGPPARLVYAPDLRGHGASAHAGGAAAYTFAALQQDLLHFLREVVRAPCHLLGHSMGGMVALRTALAAPELISSLMLMSTTHAPLTHVHEKAVALGGRIAREQGMPALAKIIRAREAQDEQRSAASLRHEQQWSAARYAAWREARLHAMDPQAYEALARAMLQQQNLAQRLPELAAPALVLCGEQDSPFVAPSRFMAREIPDAKLVMLPNAAHQPQFEAPQAWRTAVREWLQGKG